MMTAVISKIISMQNNLTVSENEIAQYVMNNAEEVVTSTITNIAKSTNTSEASINRFCKKLGFKGFNSFKIALAQENFYNSMKEKGASDDVGFISSISKDYRQMIMNTSAMLDEDLLSKAVESIKKAERVYIFAYSSTSLIAQELEFKLNTIGINAKAVLDINFMRVAVTNIKKNDLAVVIAPTLLMRDIYHVLTSCKERGAQVLTITSYDSPKLNDLVDYRFVTSDKITAKNSLSLSNNIIFLFVIDIIFSMMLDSDKSLRQKKLNSDAAMRTNQMLDNYILEF